MSVTISLTVTNNNPNTIHNRLKARLGREPSNTELVAEVKRIQREALVDMASRGKLRMQK